MAMTAAQRRYHEKMKDDPEYKAKRAELRRKSYLKLKDDVITAYGGKCACCGEKERAFLCLDHVDGGGNDERRGMNGSTWNKSSQAIYRAVRAAGYPPGYQVLCANCNLAKEREGGCPHQKGRV